MFHQFYWENKKNYRYYTADLETDLLGDWVLSLTWGRKGTKLGGKKQQVFFSKSDALIAIDAIQKRRQCRGYCPLENLTKNF